MDRLISPVAAIFFDLRNKGGELCAMSTNEQPTTPWSLAVMLITRWLEKSERADALLDSLPREVAGVERARCQHLLFGALRHKGRVDSHLQRLVARAPRPRLSAVLLVAGFELIEGGDEGHAARVVHHAVEQTKTLASQPEARMVNAVVRKLAAALAEEKPPAKLAGAEQLAAWFSHPAWLVQRWLAQFGAAGARALLEWNQKPAPVHARWRASRAPSEAELAWLAPSRWEQFYEVRAGNWPSVEAAITAGDLYLQDPSTRLAVGLLAPQAGESILDACAAPGGKCLAIADAIRANADAEKLEKTLLVAMDLPGARVDRLKENLSRAPEGMNVALVQGDLLAARPPLFDEHNLPAEYNAVLLDAPCSNTGVMRHRVDVKWRLQPNDFTKHARQQLALLEAAARRVRHGGRLIYSTCSIDAEENEHVVTAFLERPHGPGGHGRFALEKSVQSFPWMDGHDGACAFLLRRR
ncbi:16S rRNA (cytosine967-C5)-methyltransferase [Ereboglobus sp. PH5-5]|nr:16S rRNA (cytosine967-C5)-methyltransferase [Ereboglobus sp. PH5-5]